jgi:hypothetical protein
LNNENNAGTEQDSCRIALTAIGSSDGFGVSTGADFVLTHVEGSVRALLGLR